MSAKPPPLPEPIVIAKWWKSRRRNIAMVVSLSAYEGINIINVREYFTDHAGRMKPSTRGVAMGVRNLPEFSKAMRKALEKARELDLLPEEGGE
jgi:Transcriptional Coactivator p15 (PC4)